MSDAPAPGGSASGLTHIDEHGKARMVDVTHKPLTVRTSRARARVVWDERSPVRTGGVEWNELLEQARLAGIQAAKATAYLIPLCHQLTISGADVQLGLEADGVDIEGRAEVVGRTGVEMEALTACGVAGLAVVAALLPLDPDVYLEDLTLWEKHGGKSGDYRREPS